MVKKNIFAITFIMLGSSGNAFSADYTKYAGWKTKPVPIPANPAYTVDYGCSVSKNRNSLKEKLDKLGWADSDALVNSTDFNKVVTVVISKKTFNKNQIIKFKGLYTESNKLVAHYKIKGISSGGNGGGHSSFGLTGHRPALVVNIPKQIYNKGNLVCRKSN